MTTEVAFSDRRSQWVSAARLLLLAPLVAAGCGESRAGGGSGGTAGTAASWRRGGGRQRRRRGRNRRRQHRRDRRHRRRVHRRRRSGRQRWTRGQRRRVRQRRNRQHNRGRWRGGGAVQRGGQLAVRGAQGVERVLVLQLGANRHGNVHRRRRRVRPDDWGHTAASNPAPASPPPSRRSSPSTSLVLGFNEPDNSTQSNIPVATAINLWPSFLNPSIQVVSPATQANTTGQSWFSSFMTKASAANLRVDVVGLTGTGGTPDRASERHPRELHQVGEGKTGTRPIWLTEWGACTTARPTRRPW